MKKGKAYTNRRPKNLVTDLRASDFYETPYSCTEELIKTGILKGSKMILEPCAGKGAIAKVLEKHGFTVFQRDIKNGNDFLKDHYDYASFDTIVTNPPFSLWSEIIEKAKEVSPKVIAIGKTNFLGVQDRYERKLWENLSDIYVFTRQIDYQFPVMENGDVGVGNLISGWFVWQRCYTAAPRLHFINMQPYCKLGGYEKWLKEHPEYEQEDSFTFEGKTYTQSKLELGETDGNKNN